MHKLDTQRSKNKKYFYRTFSMAFFLIPFIFSFCFIIFIMFTASFQLAWILALIPIVLIWYNYYKNLATPTSLWLRYRPVVIAFLFYILSWLILMQLTRYVYSGTTAEAVFLAATFPYFLLHFFLVFAGIQMYFPFIQLSIFFCLFLIITVFTFISAHKKAIQLQKGLLLLTAIFSTTSFIVSYQFIHRNNILLQRDDTVATLKDEVNIYDYMPFTGSRLLSPVKNSSLRITNNYPVLDGATAAYPVYAALAESVYVGLNADTIASYVDCTQTTGAYERLIAGEIDIFFGAQPSKKQMDLAKEKGITFTKTPIAKEAFVFFVNSNNFVNSLTIEEIQNIYTKDITNWQDVGGANEKIIAFQRPENSGSQTIMEAKVMNNIRLYPPLIEEYAEGMGGIISEVASYRNYSSAIGYSFRYFATGMKQDTHVKLLAINDIEPTKENIQNGSYPFTVDVYAITTTSTNKHVPELLAWLQSEEGQSLIENNGYVRYY